MDGLLAQRRRNPRTIWCRCSRAVTQAGADGRQKCWRGRKHGVRRARGDGQGVTTGTYFLMLTISWRGTCRPSGVDPRYAVLEVLRFSRRARNVGSLRTGGHGVPGRSFCGPDRSSPPTSSPPAAIPAGTPTRRSRHHPSSPKTARVRRRTALLPRGQPRQAGDGGRVRDAVFAFPTLACPATTATSNGTTKASQESCASTALSVVGEVPRKANRPNPIDRIRSVPAPFGTAAGERGDLNPRPSGPQPDALTT